MSDQATTAVGQVSADGQFRWDGTQWVPIPRGAREPTSWTRPMQLAAAGLFTCAALYSVISTLIFVNHDSMLRAIKAQGTRIPAGTDIDTIVNFSIAFAIGVVVVFGVIELVVAAGSYFGWRWMFWVALVLFALSGLGAIFNLAAFARPETTTTPVWGLVVTEIFSLASLGMFIWLLIGVIKFGPWAMKRPGT